MARVIFFCHDSRANIESFEYYRQDIEALEALGHTVEVCTSVASLPRKFDLIFIWWWTHALVPVLVARLSGRSALITGIFNFQFPRGFAGTDYLRRPWWQRTVISLATRLATLNLFSYAAELEQCRRHFGLANAAPYLITLHDDYLQGQADKRELAIFNLAWSGKGNLVRKGIPELLQAVRILHDRGTRVSLTLAGPPGDGAGWVRQRIDELDLGRHVTILGALSRDEKIAALRRFEIYAQPSHFEGFGLATAEAMGSGACVVTCDAGAVRSVVGDAGVYATPGDAESLADALARVITDHGLRARLQASAVERARTHFASTHKRRRLAEILAQVGI